MAHAQKSDFVFRRNGRVHLNRRGSSVHSTAGSRGVRISGSNAGYTVFRCSVRRVLATHFIRQFPLHFPSLRHRVPSHFKWTLLRYPSPNYPRSFPKTQTPHILQSMSLSSIGTCVNIIRSLYIKSATCIPPYCKHHDTCKYKPDCLRKFPAETGVISSTAGQHRQWNSPSFNYTM